MGQLTVESFSLNSAKSFLGKNVNLHLKDGAVIVNVQLTGIRKGDFGKGNMVEYVPYGNRKSALRERQLPWVFLSMIDDLLRGKAHAGVRGGVAAC